MMKPLFLFLVFAVLATTALRSGAAGTTHIQIRGKLNPSAILVAGDLNTPEDVRIEITRNGSGESICTPVVNPKKSELCIAMIDSWWDDFLITIRSLQYETYTLRIPLPKNKQSVDIGVVDLKRTHQDLVIVDIAKGRGSNLSFEFKLKNVGKQPAFIKGVQFLFYPGSGIYSVCMPKWFTLYEFPLTALFGEQRVSVSSGEKLAKDYSVNKNILEDRIYISYMRDGGKNPFLRTAVLEISQVVPPNDVDRFKIKFEVDQKYANSVPQGCGWSEIYAAHAIILYDQDKQLISPKFPISYYPSRSTPNNIESDQKR